MYSHISQQKMSVSATAFLSEYHGHRVSDLSLVLNELRQRHDAVIFLAGDSSLDNKFWLHGQVSAINGYEAVISPPTVKPDVCYHLNVEAMTHPNSKICCINTAIEATSLNDRAFCHLLAQDRFIRDNIGPEDTLVVSIGGNDIALVPVLCTCVNIVPLVCCTPIACLEAYGCACPPNLRIDGGCFCCGLPGCLAGLFGCPPGLGYFADMFGNRVQNYIEQLVSVTKPRKVIVSMIYFPDEVASGSWADGALSALCYDCYPYRLQAAIRKVYEVGTSRIRITGTEVVPFPLFETLDGKTSADYEQRVEPSTQGGQKIAQALMRLIHP
mmetsp:Transcript_117899/g.263563  ORF Transcript_117899/g.263563 Transcript_117899/m.263563 type:complete len:327 (+) Transcript_117899:90-1070(+)